MINEKKKKKKKKKKKRKRRDTRIIAWLRACPRCYLIFLSWIRFLRFKQPWQINRPLPIITGITSIYQTHALLTPILRRGGGGGGRHETSYTKRMVNHYLIVYSPVRWSKIRNIHSLRKTFLFFFFKSFICRRRKICLRKFVHVAFVLHK